MENDQFHQAIQAFDAYHRKDPDVEYHEGAPYPKELLYAMRMTDRLNRFAPDAAEAVKLAARSQHIGRWEIPRSTYPADRKGYLLWRNTLKQHHADLAEKILLASGYEQETIAAVRFLILKKQLYSNPDTQLLEDVVCLVFIEFYLEAFAAKHDDDKVLDILRKTLKKMSPRAVQEAPGLVRAPNIKALLGRL